MRFSQGFTVSFVGQLRGAKWSVDMFDCTIDGGGWVNIGTLDGSESLQLSDPDRDHTVQIIYIICHDSLLTTYLGIIWLLKWPFSSSRSTALATAAAGSTSPPSTAVSPYDYQITI